MTMSPGTEAGIFCLSNRVPKDSIAGPVIGGVLEPLVRGEPSFDNQALSGPLRHWRYAAQTSQRVIVSALQRFACIGEQSGEDNSAYTGE